MQRHLLAKFAEPVPPSRSNSIVSTATYVRGFMESWTRRIRLWLSRGVFGIVGDVGCVEGVD
eukprot:COSAG02_NODE_1378_length_12990_cov_3.643705_11_plen_62_part_00